MNTGRQQALVQRQRALRDQVGREFTQIASTRGRTEAPAYVPGQTGRSASRGTACVAMAFDTKGLGLRVTRRTSYGQGACGEALVACRKSVVERTRKSKRFRGADCRVIGR